MTDQLSIYNDALLLCGERALASLTEEREPRRLLDQVWTNGGINHCLEQGQWFFAMRTVQLDYDVSFDPSFGYQYAFTKPDDWILTSALCVDEYFRVPLLRYHDEGGNWYADDQIIYVRYVSNDSGYGTAYNRWPESFKEFVAAHFASKIVLKATGDADKTKLVLELRKKLLGEAKNRAAMALPTSFPAQGSWSRSRGRYGSRRDGGNNGGSLIG